MSVFFELTTDVFKERFDRLGQGGPVVTRAGAPSARRPMRGLEVKEDTFAMFKVIDLLGREIKLYDSSSFSGKATAYTNFILQAVQEVRSEKFQIVETFGDPYIFFFGEAPRFLDCAAVLINSQDFNWQAEFWANYDQYLRGSKCAELGARIYMFYDDKVVEGYMVNAQAANDAQNPMMVQLQFKLFLTNYRNISMVGDPRFPIRLGVDVSMATLGVDTNTGTTVLVDGQVLQRRNLADGPAQRTQLLNTNPQHPVRGLIYDNEDEWTGARPPAIPDSGLDDVDDLIRVAVEKAAENYTNMNNVDTLNAAGLTNANSGQGTGGAVPASNGSLVADDSKGCTTSEFIENGQRFCTGANGAKIFLGFDCGITSSASGCPSPPPAVPPGATTSEMPATSSEQNSSVYVPPPPTSTPTGTGVFTSSTAGPPCNPDLPPSMCQRARVSE